MQAKAFNPQSFLEFLCYAVFGGLLLYLVGSGAYLSYVTPRMAPYLCFAAVVMMIWAAVGLFRLFRPQHRIRSAHCFVLALPILLLLLPHSPLSTSDLSGSYIGGNAFNSLSGSDFSLGQSLPDEADSGTTEEDPTTDSTQGDATDVQEEWVYSSALAGLDAANKKITVSNEDFGLWTSEIYTNMEKYEGYTITITGFVFTDAEVLGEDEFIPARLMMSCCVADLTPAGLLCKYDRVSELEENSWVTVEGTLFIGQYEYEGQSYDDPQITVTTITPAEEVEGYVYPY